MDELKKNKSDVTGFVLAGGKSRRFKASAQPHNDQSKRGKAYALYNARPLFQWAYDTIAPIVDHVHLSFNSK